MNFDSLSNFKRILIYALTILIIYLSGNIFFMSFYYSQSVIFIALFASLTLLVCGSLKYKNHGKVILLFLFLTLCMLITILLNAESNVMPYIAIALQIYIAIIFSNIVDFLTFEKLYVKIIFFFAVVSLFCFALSQIYPDISYLFPKTEAIASLNYYNAIIFVFTSDVNYHELVIFNRNSGIFWEPGCYQAFLNIGIYFLFDLKNKHSQIKHMKIILIILIFTVLSTYSTNGYIILLILLIGFHKTIASYFLKDKKKLANSIILFIVAFALLTYVQYITFPFNIIINKIKNEFANGGINALGRISLDKIHYLFYNKGFNFFGMSFSAFFALKESCWNSVIQTLICLGIPFTGFLLLFYYSSSKRIISKSILFFILLLMCFSTETLFWRPFFLYLIFTGLYSREGVKAKNENSMVMQYDVAENSNKNVETLK